MTVSSKRSENVAWVSLGLSVVFFLIAFFVGRWSGFAAVSGVAWIALAAVLIWFVLAIQFHQRALAEQEKLDMGRLGVADKTDLFEAENEQAAVFAVAQKRLEILEKWFLPIFSGAIAIYEIVVGIVLFRGLRYAGEFSDNSPFLMAAVTMTAIAFMSFLISRYATGMSAQTQWKPLRAGGSVLLIAAVLSFIHAIALALAQFQVYSVLRIANYIAPVLLIILGVENAANVILDIYRPRLKGQYSRAGFDSRLLGLVNEPGGIFHSLASAIDYQFGFKVSQTWFYRLLEKAILPLALFGAVSLYLMSCVVVVGPDEQAVIERFGKARDAQGEVRLVGPGLSFKWPWPFGRVYTQSTEKIQEIFVGFVPRTDPATGEIIRETELLWGKEHYEEEFSLVVAVDSSRENTDDGAVPVNLINANIPIQYKIKNLADYLYKHRDAQELLEAICYHELAKFAASATVEVAEEGVTDSENLFGAGRDKAKQVLTDNIQAAADARQLGIEVVFLGLQGIHPPVEVAANYQEVIGAVQESQARILNAHAERNLRLATLVGSVEEADELYELAAKYEEARNSGDKTEADRLAGEIDNAFGQAKGEIFATLKQAQGDAYSKATLAKAIGERFQSQLKAYHAAEDIYMREQRFRALTEGLKGIRKYVLAIDPNSSQVYRVNLEEKRTMDIYDIGGIEEPK